MPLQNGGSESPTSVRRKPNKDVAELYKQQIARASPPPSPKVTGSGGAGRTRPARDITQLYTGKLEVAAGGPVNGAEKVSPRKVKLREPPRGLRRRSTTVGTCTESSTAHTLFLCTL